MRIVYFDCDTLRPDHLSCYGYHRSTSPNIDRVAAEGVRFENCYVSDAPCLPSRCALFTGRFGIHTGVVGHGGTAADMWIQGSEREFTTSPEFWPFPMVLEQMGFYTVSISPFAERHAAWWFYAGWREMHNPGKRGHERADEVAPIALEWIKRNARRDNWFLHINFWDPHTPYRTPPEYGNPFEDDPPPDWISPEVLEEHLDGYGRHSAPERSIATMADVKRWIDGYDTGIRYMDDHIGQILDALAHEGVLDDLVIIVSADHGENQGELNMYGDHGTADYLTSRVPLIVRWPGGLQRRVDRALHYQADLGATLVELVGGQIPETWDGLSFADSLRVGQEKGRDALILSMCVMTCQRAVRWGSWIMIRTYHDGYNDLPPFMLFNVERDPYELHNLADLEPQVTDHGLRLLEEWYTQMMSTSPSAIDPLWTVMQEGGPYHVRGWLEQYCQRLRETGRSHHADALEARHGVGR